LPSHSQAGCEILNDVSRHFLHLEPQHPPYQRPTSRCRERQSPCDFQNNLIYSQFVSVLKMPPPPSRDICTVNHCNPSHKPPKGDHKSQHCTQDRPQLTSLSIPIDDFHTSWVRHSPEAGLRLVGTLLDRNVDVFCVVRILKQEKEKVGVRRNFLIIRLG
jgi:hypothetical protein